MKAGLKATAVLIGVFALLVGLRLFHLGPFGIRPGDDITLAQARLTNGDQLFVVAHRTQSVAEPYEVTLYRLEATGEAVQYWMGYEDSYWWACSIRPTTNSSVLQIRADGSPAAFYSLPEATLTLADNYYHYGVQTGRRVPVGAVPLIIARREP
jgi:hypothetical protein